MDKRVCLDVTSVDSAKKSAEISPVDGPTLKGNVIREVAVTPNRSEISVVISEDGVRNVEMIHPAVKEGAGIELVGEVGVVVAVVILPKMQMINGAVNNAHAYKLTKGTELFNNKGNQIIDFKKVLVVIKYRYSLFECFDLLFNKNVRICKII